MKRKKILFVCTGNTCRSPMAELLLRDKIKKNKIKWWDVSSSGTSAKVGDTINPNSREALREVGIDCKEFKSKQLNQKLISTSFLVICMTSEQKQILEDCGNVICVRDLCGFDVPDPFGYDLSAYQAVRKILDKVCDKIIDTYIKGENK